MVEHIAEEEHPQQCRQYPLNNRLITIAHGEMLNKLRPTLTTIGIGITPISRIVRTTSIALTKTIQGVIHLTVAAIAEEQRVRTHQRHHREEATEEPAAETKLSTLFCVCLIEG